MTDLQQLLDEYLATRRALGVRFKLSGSLLQRFAPGCAPTANTPVAVCPRIDRTPGAAGHDRVATRCAHTLGA